MKTTVGDVLDAVGTAFPWEWAEDWDNVGLVLGDPDAVVEGVLVTLDSDTAAVCRAADQGASVIVTHHPPFMSLPSQITPSTADVLLVAAAKGVALIAAHTNLDRAPSGAGVLLEALGLGAGEPVEVAVEMTGVVTVYAPPSAADAVRTALHESGAGRIGVYEACSFTGEGAGRFFPGEGSSPAEGAVGSDTKTDEVRVEAVCPNAAFGRVSAAVTSTHPYEEPLITWSEIGKSRGQVALGRVTDLQTPTTLGGFVDRVGQVFGCVPRVWGDPDTAVGRVATGTGSAGSLVGAVERCQADVLLAGEVRYHDALDAMHRGIAVIEAGHDVTEWPLVPVLAEAVRGAHDLSGEKVIVEQPTRHWWTP